ncbi:ZIP family metal transporter [Aurantiacibacter atlanticus]|nr:divalent cation transporter [Aurantiacibacter atlanticus]
MMQTAVLATLFGAIGGSAAYAGAWLGYLDERGGGSLSGEAKRGITAFGGGALIGAVGLVLVPHGIETQPLWLGAASFVLGGLAFLLLDKWLHSTGTPVSQLVALNLDFIPEAIVVGAVIGSNLPMAIFLTVILVAQNLPEGFGAYVEVRKAHEGFVRHHILRIMALAIVIGPVAALLGYSFFAMQSTVLGTIMTFCAGGIIYLVFDDVAPEAHGNGEWAPAFGAVVGFAVALIGFGLTG